MKNKTAAEVVNEVLMLSSIKKGYAFLIVEGRDDWRFWKTRVHAMCDIVDATGKTEGISAVHRLNRHGFVGHVGVFDRDYSDALTNSNWQTNKVFWDAHSLETVLFYSSAFDAAVVEHTDQEKLSALQTKIGKPLRDAVEWIAAAVGAVRYVHHLSGNTSDANRLFPTNYMQHDPFAFDENALHAAGVSIGAAPSIAQLKALTKEHATISARLLIRGHDVSAIAAWIIRCCGGTCGHERVEQIFRTSFARAELEATTVHKELRAWEAARTPRRVLP